MAHLYFITEVIFIKPTKNCIRNIKYLFTRISVLSFRWIFAVFVLRGWKWISSEDGDSKDQLISSLADFILHLMSHLSEKFVNCYLVYKQLALQTRSNLTIGTCCIVQKKSILTTLTIDVKCIAQKAYMKYFTKTFLWPLGNIWTLQIFHIYLRLRPNILETILLPVEYGPDLCMGKTLNQLLLSVFYIAT